MRFGYMKKNVGINGINSAGNVLVVEEYEYLSHGSNENICVVILHRRKNNCVDKSILVCRWMDGV